MAFLLNNPQLFWAAEGTWALTWSLQMGGVPGVREGLGEGDGGPLLQEPQAPERPRQDLRHMYVGDWGHGGQLTPSMGCAGKFPLSYS